MPKPKAGHRRHERPHKALQGEEQVADKETPWHKDVEERNGGAHLEREVLHRGDGPSLTQGLQEEADGMSTALWKDGEGHVEQEAHEAQHRERLENQQALAVSAAEAHLRRDENVQQANHPVHSHHHDAHHRHHHPRRQASCLGDVVDGVSCQRRKNQSRNDAKAHEDRQQGQGEAAVHCGKAQAQMFPGDLRWLTCHVPDRQLVHAPVFSDPMQRGGGQELGGQGVRQHRHLFTRAVVFWKLLLRALQVVVVPEDHEHGARVLQRRRARLTPPPHFATILLTELVPGQAWMVGACGHILFHQDLLQKLMHPLPPIPIVVAHGDLQVPDAEALAHELQDLVLVGGGGREAFQLQRKLRQRGMPAMEALADPLLPHRVQKRKDQTQHPKQQISSGCSPPKVLRSKAQMVLLGIQPTKRHGILREGQVGRMVQASARELAAEVRAHVDPGGPRTHEQAVQGEEVVPLVEEGQADPREELFPQVHSEGHVLEAAQQPP
mmetsp:Transcript_134800/g.319522  ORF Transcript_134800/g.319522 Transcript_134800/m.319522 type:complete len:495 (+) Transcript_134800:978-2462(+)